MREDFQALTDKWAERFKLRSEKDVADMQQFEERGALP